jgi:acetyl-CoA carboxylase biotin carboxyl carrier protein
VNDELEPEMADSAEAPETAEVADAPEAESPVATGGGEASLMSLIDRLGGMLDRSDLTELEVEVGGTALVLRKPAALAQQVAAVAVADPAGTAAGAPVPGSAATGVSSADASTGAPARPSIKAPLTGIWYASPTPGSAPFVEVGREVAVGQVVGLIEAMKLFNEIKSELAGRVVRVVPESGSLVKAKQPLIEVEPL